MQSRNGEDMRDPALTDSRGKAVVQVSRISRQQRISSIRLRFGKVRVKHFVHRRVKCEKRVPPTRNREPLFGKRREVADIFYKQIFLVRVSASGKSAPRDARFKAQLIPRTDGFGRNGHAQLSVCRISSDQKVVEYEGRASVSDRKRNDCARHPIFARQDSRKIVFALEMNQARACTRGSRKT